MTDPTPPELGAPTNSLRMHAAELIRVSAEIRKTAKFPLTFAVCETLDAQAEGLLALASQSENMENGQ